MKIPVFDLDWTLLAKKEPRVHQHAILYAVKKLYDVDPQSYNGEGQIDNQIIINILAQGGIPKEDALLNLSKLQQATIDYFMEHKNDTEWVTLPGVREALQMLYDKNIPMGLLTGNLEPIGWEKLRLAGIDQYFQFGAFGNMGLTRPDLVPIAAIEASKALQRNVLVSDLVVIGDTPLDVECAKIGGAHSVAVATSPGFNMNKLKKSGADLVLKNLKEIDKLLKFLKD